MEIVENLAIILPDHDGSRGMGVGVSPEGGGLQYKNAWMCVLGSENVPILKDAKS